MNRQCHQKQMKQKLCNGFCAFFKSMYVNPDNREKKEKKKKKRTNKKKLVYYQNLIKESKAASCWWLGFYLLYFFGFPLHLLWEGVSCSSLGRWEHCTGSTRRSGRTVRVPLLLTRVITKNLQLRHIWEQKQSYVTVRDVVYVFWEGHNVVSIQGMWRLWYLWKVWWKFPSCRRITRLQLLKSRQQFVQAGDGLEERAWIRLWSQI